METIESRTTEPMMLIYEQLEHVTQHCDDSQTATEFLHAEAERLILENANHQIEAFTKGVTLEEQARLSAAIQQKVHQLSIAATCIQQHGGVDRGIYEYFRISLLPAESEDFQTAPIVWADEPEETEPVWEPVQQPDNSDQEQYVDIDGQPVRLSQQLRGKLFESRTHSLRTAEGWRQLGECVVRSMTGIINEAQIARGLVQNYKSWEFVREQAEAGNVTPDLFAVRRASEIVMKVQKDHEEITTVAYR